MSLEKLELGNFKAFGDIQTIDFKPLTLLFGANSAGKSTILQSLIYLSEAFKQGNWDIYSTQQGGEFIDFGGMRNVVHKKDLSNIIHFGLTISGLNIFSLFHLKRDNVEITPDVEDLLINNTEWFPLLVGRTIDLQDKNIPHYKCTFTVRFGVNPANGLLEYFSINEDKASLCTFSNSEQIDNEIEPEGLVLNLKRDNNDENYTAETLNPFSRFFLKRIQFDNSEFQPNLELEYSEEGFKGRKREILEGIENIGIEFDDQQLISFWNKGEYQFSNINVKYVIDELHCINSFFGFDSNVDSSHYPVKNEFYLNDYLSNIQHLGYFRPVPERFIYKSGYHRLDDNLIDDIWRKLLEDEYLRNSVNKYLSEPDKLDMGYKLEVNTWKTQSKISRDGRQFKTLEIRDLHNDTIVNLRELGLGVVQTIPMLAAMFNYGFKLISIEQPELHLHPGLQSRIGQMFAEIVKEKSFANYLDHQSSIPSKQLLIETHSEHIVKAIQLEVAKQDGIDKEDVNIIYIQRDNEKPQSIVRRIELDKSGSFNEPWPDDFFELSADLTMERLSNIYKTKN